MESGHGMLDHLGSSLSFPTKEPMPVPALEPYLIEPIFEQFSALIPARQTPTRSDAIVPASPITWSLRSWCKYWCSAALTRGSPTSPARLPRLGTGATSGSSLG